MIGLILTALSAMAGTGQSLPNVLGPAQVTQAPLVASPFAANLGDGHRPTLQEVLNQRAAARPGAQTATAAAPDTCWIEYRWVCTPYGCYEEYYWVCI